MTYDLLSEQWIPVRRRSGRTDRIAPSELTDSTDDPVIGVHATRPDFSGALVQFLIGLIQLAMPPRNDREWFDRADDPPSEKDLETAFEPYRHAFVLDSGSLRFMQDPTVREEEKKAGVLSLLIEMPGAQTVKQNGDLFIKRRGGFCLCRPCAGMTLLTLQLNAPAGGAGNRTSLRGGGPFTTLVLGDTLWRTVWNNVLPSTAIEELAVDNDKDTLEDKLPWTGTLRVSDKKGGPTTPADAHPLQMYWSTARRIWFDFEETGTCSMCGAQGIVASNYRARPYGPNYEGGWAHPLTPHNVNKDGSRTPRHGNPGIMSYRHWLGLVDGVVGSREPARVVATYRRNRLHHLDEDSVRLWAFGYDMDNMKARAWYESVMPVYHVPQEHIGRYTERIEALLSAAEDIAATTRGQIKKAMFRRPEDKKGDMSFVTEAFWQRTEERFYRTADQIRTTLDADGPPVEVNEEWLTSLQRMARLLFDEATSGNSIGDADPKRIAIAWNDLLKFTNKAKLRSSLGLPTRKKRDTVTVTA